MLSPPSMRGHFKLSPSALTVTLSVEDDIEAWRMTIDIANVSNVDSCQFTGCPFAVRRKDSEEEVQEEDDVNDIEEEDEEEDE